MKWLLVFGGLCAVLLLAVLIIPKPAPTEAEQACVIDLKLQRGHAQVRIQNCRRLENILRELRSSDENRGKKTTSRRVVLPNNERRIGACPQQDSRIKD